LKDIVPSVTAEIHFLTSLQNVWYENIQKNDTLKAYIKPIFEDLHKNNIISTDGLVGWKEKADKSKGKVQALIKVNAWLTELTTVKETEGDDEEENEEEEDEYLQNPNKEFLT